MDRLRQIGCCLGLVAMLVMAGCEQGGVIDPGDGGDGNAGNGGSDGGDGNSDGSGDEGGSGGGVDPGARVQRFAVIGDYGDDDPETERVANLVKSWEPDFILTTGDNDYSDGFFKGTFEGLELAVGQYFHEYIGNYQGREGIGADENRFFPTPGDHDWGDTCEDPSGLDDYLAYFTLPDGNSGNERYYDFVRGNVHFFSIHSIRDCEIDGATEDSAQADWVRETVLASDAAFKVAYLHNPPYSSGARHIGDGDHMRWPWAEWGFDLVMAGDDHIYERIERDGVVYLVNGVGGVELHEFAGEAIGGSVVRYADAFGAVLVDVFENQMVVSFATVEGTVEDEFTLTLDGATTDEGGGTGGGETGHLAVDVPPVTEGDWFKPDVTATWQWQLQRDPAGDINLNYVADYYDIDLFEADDALIDELHELDRQVLCYFSAGSYEDFRSDSSFFETSDLGKTLDGFEDERWLDIRSANVQDIMLARLDLAVERGCDGVEPDNVDGYTNDSGFDLSAEDQLAFNRFLANAAHERGLTVALKNDLDQVEELVDYFDLALNEQCHEFDECDLLQPFIEAGKPVFNAEYDQPYVDDANARAELCASAVADGLQTLVLPLDLDDSFRFACWE
jgi:hypothetical protein